jgi:hypothetical protein
MNPVPPPSMGRKGKTRAFIEIGRCVVFCNGTIYSLPSSPTTRRAYTDWVELKI